MYPPSIPQQTAHRIIETITQRVGQCSVYVLNSRINNRTFTNNQVNTESVSAHFYCILVITRTKNTITASNIANTIAERSGKSIPTTVLLHKVSDLSTKQPNQQWFFDRVLRFGQRLSLDKSTPPYVVSNNPSRDIEADKTFWLKCVAVAQFNIQAAKENPQLEVELCKIALLHTACVQIALGLIRVHLGYTPNEFGLNYLLQLCGHFTTLPPQLFSRKTERNLKRYKMLCAPPSMLNHWSKLHASEEDFLYLLDATQQFLELSNLNVTNELN